MFRSNIRLFAAAALLSGCTATEQASPSASWRPAPLEGVTEPHEVIARSTPADWREISSDDLMVLELADGGRVFIELAPDFAPVHVANVRAFARRGWWDAATIYRVQDNYVAQWGNGDSEAALPDGVVRIPPAEYDRDVEELALRPLGVPDSYAPMVGHHAGWPVAWDPRSGRAWLTHCYGSVGVGRDVSPDTGTGGELYAVIGHAPRHLDRNIATIGRVIEGMALLSARPRGTGDLGFYQVDRGERPIAIRTIRLASALSASERPTFEVMRTDGEAFAAYVRGRANRGGTFFIRPAGGVDLCNVNVPVRRRP